MAEQSSKCQKGLGVSDDDDELKKACCAVVNVSN